MSYCCKCKAGMCKVSECDSICDCHPPSPPSEGPRKLLELAKTAYHGIRAFASYGRGASLECNGVSEGNLQRAHKACEDMIAIIEASTEGPKDIRIDCDICMDYHDDNHNQKEPKEGLMKDAKDQEEGHENR